jgi:competence protein ComEC
VEHNNRSIGLMVRFGAFQAFLSGDSEAEELAWFLEHDAVPDVTLLKAAHHGSDNGLTAAFLERARPEVVVVSVGNNGYGHPMPGALDAYASYAREVYRTDLHGAVTVHGHRDGSYEVITEAGEAAARGRAQATW